VRERVINLDVSEVESEPYSYEVITLRERVRITEVSLG
jgi:hypothetical protein